MLQQFGNNTTITEWPRIAIPAFGDGIKGLMRLSYSHPVLLCCPAERMASPISCSAQYDILINPFWKPPPCALPPAPPSAPLLPPRHRWPVPTARAPTCAASDASNAPAPSDSLLGPSCPGPPPLTPTAHEPRAGQTNRPPAHSVAPFQGCHGHAQPLPRPATGGSGGPQRPLSGSATATGAPSNPGRVPPGSSFPSRAMAPPPPTSPITQARRSGSVKGSTHSFGYFW
jgi:hypothetical protein